MDVDQRLDTSLIRVSVAIGVVIIFYTVLSRIVSDRKRKAELASWISNARAKRELKHHKCLKYHISSFGESCDDNIEDSLYSASETQRLILSGNLNVAENLSKLARRCRKYGRGKKFDTGVNAITEEFYDEEYEVVKSLMSNTALKAKQDDFAPLYGVPISVKDCIAMKGALQTGGLACRASESHRSTEDSPLIQILRYAGALPIVRGNVGQLMMLPESYNHVWGRSRNPWDLTRVPGGSSGGEAALVSMKCVPLAIGCDGAGSIRIPSSYCGVVGFKPTSIRLSNLGSMKPRKDNRNGLAGTIPAVPGPIARVVEDCARFMKAVCRPDYFQLDPNVAPIPFNSREYEDEKKFKVGYFVSDGWFEPCSAAKRGLMETITLLKSDGHECISFELPNSGWETYALLVSLHGADGNMREFVDALEGENMIESYKTLYKVANLPNFFRPVVRKIIDKRRGHLVGCIKSGGLTVHEFWQKNAELLAIREKWGQSFVEAGIDALIHPALPTPALPHGISGDFTASFSYTFLANILMWPSGVVPVTTVREDEQDYKIEDIPIDQRDSFANLAKVVMRGSAGLPISVAIMTSLFQDEKCLRIMKQVEKLVKFDKEPYAYKTAMEMTVET